MAEKKTAASDTAAGKFQEQTTARASGERASGEAVEIDPLIASVERVYQALTGSPPPPMEEAYAPIPVERDPGEYVSQHFETLVEALQQPSAPRVAPWSPALTVWESEREMVLHVDLAGVRRQDVEVSLDGTVLSVRGKRAGDHDGARLRLNERPLGAFERRVVLPPRVDRSEPTARLEDGVLEVRLPKLERESSPARREIRVN
jgi:HSP20 family molecular chaperone IbpA